jgi:hypothetical protein
VIPVIFTYVDDAVQRIDGWLHRKRARQAPPAPTIAQPDEVRR